MLFDASACTYNIPTHFFVYNASSNALTQIPDAPNAANHTSYQTRMLVLPNGQVLYNDGSSEIEVYTAGGTPNPAWAPSIKSLSATNLARGSTYSRSGKQLAGLDPGATYGDGVRDNTNFPPGTDHQFLHRRGDVRPDARLELGVDCPRRQLLDPVHNPQVHAQGQEHFGRGRERNRLSTFDGDNLLRTRQRSFVANDRCR